MRYLLLTLMLVFASGPAVAGNMADEGAHEDDMPMSMEDVDMNGDGDITEEEFDETYAGSSAADHWDLDDDGKVDESEFSTGKFGMYDANHDGNITEEEWEVASKTTVSFEEWDVDNDNFLDDEEIGDGIFDFYDTDGNGMWDDQEFDQAGLEDI